MDSVDYTELSEVSGETQSTTSDPVDWMRRWGRSAVTEQEPERKRMLNVLADFAYAKIMMERGRG